MNISQETVKSATYTIWVGLNDSLHDDGYLMSSVLAKKICQDYVDEIGLCVSFTETIFIYSQNTLIGNEPGLAIGLINYPRFPKFRYVVKNYACELAKKLLIELRQCRVVVEGPDETIMFTNDDRILIKDDMARKS